MFRHFGSKVTVVEKGAALLGQEDEDVCAAVTGILEAEGIALRFHAECLWKLEPRTFRRRRSCWLQGGAARRYKGRMFFLLSVVTRIQTIWGWSWRGFRRTARGFIDVDDQLRTKVEGILGTLGT